SLLSFSSSSAPGGSRKIQCSIGPARRCPSSRTREGRSARAGPTCATSTTTAAHHSEHVQRIMDYLSFPEDAAAVPVPASRGIRLQRVGAASALPVGHSEEKLQQEECRRTRPSRERGWIGCQPLHKIASDDLAAGFARKSTMLLKY